MAKPISDAILSDVRKLIQHTTHFEGEKFRSVEKCILTTLRKSDTMFFSNTKDIKKAIDSMAEKFQFHGFFKHADYLKDLHEQYIDKNLTESELMPRLNIVKFLLSLSESPTSQFWRTPEEFDFINAERQEEQEIDWGAYLKAGLEVASFSSSSSEDSSSEKEEDVEEVFEERRVSSRFIPAKEEEVEIWDFKKSREELLKTVQHSWFNDAKKIETPPSQYFEANVATLWMEHLSSITMGLVEMPPITVLSEYKVMREIIWQLWGPHNSTCFQFSQNEFKAKRDVTISSMRATTFQCFLSAFVPYIEILHYFRGFFKQIEDEHISNTIKKYGFVIREILENILKQVLQIEDVIRAQEETFTLIELQVELKKLFKPLFILKDVHKAVFDIEGASNLEASLKLLTSLRRKLQFCLNKLEQDIILALYIESLFYYLSMVDSWFVKNDLYDSTGEFLIVNNSMQNPDFQTHYILQDNISDYLEQDGILRIISDQVLQIGRNIHLLRLLEKFDIPARDSESIYEKFTRRFLEELGDYFGVVIEESKEEEVSDLPNDDWKQFFDSSDGFLVKVFEDMQFEEKEIVREESLFSKISKITTNLYPFQDLPEKLFLEILKDRFQISGLIVKNLLIEKFQLEKEFEFLRHTFLFWDDLIFSFHRRLFEKMNTANSNWGNSIWLTSHFQDILMDTYPNCYENCTVHVKEAWKQCRDSIEACRFINLQYEIKWPLNIIITGTQLDMYQEIFHVILKLKWGLYTINHLPFSDIEDRSKAKHLKTTRSVIQKLKFLRFNLINVLNSIQHYLFGFSFAKAKAQFELEFEKSNDLMSLINSHEVFVGAIHREVLLIRDSKKDDFGFFTLLKSVKMLKIMWNDLSVASMKNLESCYKMYRNSAQVINATVNPVFLYNY